MARATHTRARTSTCGDAGRIVAVLTAAVGVLLALPGVAHAATTTSITVTDSGGNAISGDDVEVYYWPANPAASGSAQLMASGSTNTSGVFAATLDTSMVDTTSLADDGAGLEAFNTIVVAANPGSTTFTASPQIMTFGGGHAGGIQTAGVAAMSAVSDFTQVAMTAAATPAQPTLTFTDAALCPNCDPDKTIFPKAIVDNVGDGIKGTVTYSKGFATQASVATSICVKGPWCVGPLFEEETNRNASDGYPSSNSFHYLLHARYSSREYRLERCSPRGDCQIWHEWHLHHWFGDIGNPHIPFGQYDVYTPPTFNAATASPIGVGEVKIRDKGQTETFGASFQMLNLATFLSKSQYTGNTSMTWVGISGTCTKRRWLWAASRLWPDADIVQSTCHL